MQPQQWWLWAGFIVFVLMMLALDLGVFHRKVHAISTREALRWTAFCIVLALGFNVAVYFIYEHQWLGFGAPTEHRPRLDGREAAYQFFGGWLIEQSLSVDNIFVIALVFSYFCVPPHYQHRTLFWGILGALLLRFPMILAGAVLLNKFHWIIYVFGALLIYAAVKMLLAGEDSVEPEHNPLVRIARRFFPISSHFDKEHFFTEIDGRRVMTPLFLVLLVVESTDVMFAIDSIPAVFTITKDPFLVFTSNVFAILNLRSLYFALAGTMSLFRYMKQSLVFVLAFVGVKMMIEDFYHIETALSLSIIGGILAVGVLASLVASRRGGRPGGDRRSPDESQEADGDTNPPQMQAYADD